MQLYPAIDILNGKVVRLSQGNYAAVTNYAADPVAVAESFERSGATRVHIIDLDAARRGHFANLDVIRSVKKSTNLKIQSGGGIRTLKDAEARLAAGASRIILGTVAVENEHLTRAICEEFPSQVIVSLDARAGMLATHGWQRPTKVSLVECLGRLESTLASAVIVTDIERDGTLHGPAFDQLETVLGATSIDVIASGGVSSLHDVQQLSRLKKNGRGLLGCVVGKALYEELFSLAEAIKAAA